MDDNNQIIKIAKMEKDIEFIKKEISNINTSIHDFTECADRRYAPKWIQNFVWFLFTVIVAAVISIFIK